MGLSTDAIACNGASSGLPELSGVAGGYCSGVKRFYMGFT